MKTICALALIALAMSCHLDKLFTVGGSNAGLSRGKPVGLAFRAEPAPARAGQPLDPVSVAVVDSAGTPVAGADSLITIELGEHPNGATLSGTDTAHAVNGVATFRELRIDQEGTYTLQAAAGEFPPQQSRRFDVMPPPTTTGDLTVNTNTTGDSPDPDGYTVTVDGNATQPIATNGSVTFDAVPSGNHTVALSGVAGNCSVNGGSSKTVDVPVNGTGTAAFAISCPTPAPTTGSLRVTTNTTGLNLDPDGYTAIVDGSISQPIGTGATVTFEGLTAGTHSVALNGVESNCSATEPNPQNVNVPPAGTAQATFTVVCTPLPPPTGNHLEFTDLPRTTQTGQVIPVVRITAYNASGGQVRDFTGDITVSIGTNPAGGTLAGTKVVSMHPSLGGVGEWLDLRIDQPGNGYTLRATSPGVGSATSDPFDITTGSPPPLAGATGLGYLEQPTTSRAGGTIPPFRVVATDDGGNIATGFTGAIWVTLGSNPGGATLSGTRRLVAVNGRVTFSDLSIDRPGSGYTLHVSYWPLRYKNSNPFDITP